MSQLDFFGNLLFEKRASIEDPKVPLSDKNIGELIFGMEEGEAGVRVDLASAMGVAAYFRAINLRMNTISGLRIKVFEEDDKDQKTFLKDSDAYRLLNVEANPAMSALDVRKFLQQHADNYGNGYAEIRREQNSGDPKYLWPLEGGMELKINRRRMHVVYEHTDKDGKKTTYAPENIFHIKGFSQSGLIGSPLYMQSKDLFGVAIASQKFLARFYGNNATPSLLLTTEQTLDPEDADTIAEKWSIKYGKKNQRKPAVVGKGVKVQTLTMDLDNQQITDIMKHLVLEVARVTDVPPHLLFEMGRETYNNIEQNSIGWVRDGVRPLALNFESEANRKLIPRKDLGRVRCEHSLDDLKRGDSKSMAEYLGMLWDRGGIDQAEMRKVFGWNAEEGDEKRWVQQGFAPMDMVISKFQLEIDKLQKEILAPIQKPTEKSKFNGHYTEN